MSHSMTYTLTLPAWPQVYVDGVQAVRHAPTTHHVWSQMNGSTSKMAAFSGCIDSLYRKQYIAQIGLDEATA